MNRDRDRAGVLRAWAWLATLATAAALTTAAVAQDAAPPAAPAPAAADSTAPPATPAADPNVAPATTPPPAAEAPKVETPKAETPKSEAVPAPKPKRSLRHKNALPSKSVAGAPANGAKPLAGQPQAAKPGANAAPPTAATASAKSGGSVAVKKVQAEAKAAAQPAPKASIEERTTYQYNTLGRRDPFESLVESFVGDDVGGDAPPDVGGVTVVGIVWGADAFALVEDGRGNSLILRRGDKVMNGYVEELKRDAMIVKLTVDGQSQSVAIPLTRKGEQTNGNR